MLNRLPGRMSGNRGRGEGERWQPVFTVSCGKQPFKPDVIDRYSRPKDTSLVRLFIRGQASGCTGDAFTNSSFEQTLVDFGDKLTHKSLTADLQTARTEHFRQTTNIRLISGRMSRRVVVQLPWQNRPLTDYSRRRHSSYKPPQCNHPPKASQCTILTGVEAQRRCTLSAKVFNCRRRTPGDWRDRASFFRAISLRKCSNVALPHISRYRSTSLNPYFCNSAHSTRTFQQSSLVATATV